jgi:hypothetical protein
VPRLAEATLLERSSAGGERLATTAQSWPRSVPLLEDALRRVSVLSLHEKTTDPRVWSLAYRLVAAYDVLSASNSTAGVTKEREGDLALVERLRAFVQGRAVQF